MTRCLARFNGFVIVQIIAGVADIVWWSVRRPSNGIGEGMSVQDISSMQLIIADELLCCGVGGEVECVFGRDWSEMGYSGQ